MMATGFGPNPFYPHYKDRLKMINYDRIMELKLHDPIINDCFKHAILTSGIRASDLVESPSPLSKEEYIVFLENCVLGLNHAKKQVEDQYHKLIKQGLTTAPMIMHTDELQRKLANMPPGTITHVPNPPLQYASIWTRFKKWLK